MIKFAIGFFLGECVGFIVAALAAAMMDKEGKE